MNRSQGNRDLCYYTTVMSFAGCMRIYRAMLGLAIKLSVIWFVSMGFTCNIEAKNMVYNSGLENWANPDLPDGWTSFPRPDKETKSWIMADEKEKYEGKRSLRIEAKDIKKISSIRTSAFLSPVHKNSTYTFSVYLKADQDNQKGRLEICYLNSGKSVILNKDWQRYSVTFTTTNDTSYIGCDIGFANPGIYWVDAAQLEEGEKATEYYNAPDTSRDDLPLGGIKEAPDSSVSPSVPEYKINFTGLPPKIDGRLDEECWEKSPGVFFPLRPGLNSDKERTKVKFYADTDAFYVGVISYESEGRLKTTVTKRDGPVWTDDCVELFINPSGDAKTYYHFVVNTAGTLYDARHLGNIHALDSSWDATWKAGVRKGPDFWQVEIAVPYYNFPYEELNNIWRVNIGRERPFSKEFACWTGKFHSPRTFGKITGIPVKKEDYGISVAGKPLVVEDGRSESRLGLSFEVDGTKMKKTPPRKIGTEISFKGEDIRCDTSDFTISSGKTKRILLPVVKGADKINEGSRYCQVTLRDTEKSKIIYQTPWVAYFPRLFLPGGPELSCYTTEPVMKFMVKGKGEEKDARALVRISDLSGKVIIETKSEPVEKGKKEFIIDVKKLPSGKYTGTGILKFPGGEEFSDNYEIQKLPPLESGTEVKIDKYARCLLRNGKEYLPVFTCVSRGFFDIWGISGSLDKIKEYDAANAIILFGWTTEDPKTVSSDLQASRLKEILDEAHKRNLTVSVALGEVFLNEGKITAAIALIKTIRNHPALLSWYLFDEPSLPGSYTEKYYQLVKDADPYHPAWLNGWSIGNLKSHLKATDIDSIDYYPVPKYPVSSITLTTGELGGLTSWRPVHFWVQAWGARSYDSLREPSGPELTSMVYQALISGVKMMSFYTTHLRPESYVLLEKMAELKNEIENIKEAILSPVSQPIQVSPVSSGVEVVLKFSGNKWTLLSVNTGEKTQEVSLMLPGKGIRRKVKVLFENRQIKVMDGKLHDRFAPFERHIYQWEA